MGLSIKHDDTAISKRLRQLFLLLVLLVPAMSLFVAYMLYHTGLEQQKQLLLEMVESKVMLIESVAQFDAIHSKQDHAEGAEGATISQVTSAFRGKVFGSTGEIVFAKHDSGKIHFHYPPKFHEGKETLILEMDEEIPMRDALLGKRGVGEAIDYRGKKVLAAYAPVPSLQSGIVAKIDVAELRWTYFNTFLISMGISSVIFLLGIAVFLRVTKRIQEGFEAQRKAEEEVSSLRTFLSNIINSMPSVLVGVDTEFNVTHWNTEAEIITEVKSSDAVGRPLSEVFPGIELKRSEIQESIDTSTVKRKTNIMSQSGNGARYEDLTVYPLVANGVNGVVVRIDDITEKHLLEEQFHQSKKLDAIGQLAGGVAHDFNNMLAAILGAAELLKPSVKTPKHLEYIDIILQAAHQSAELTTKLLTYGRKGDISHRPTDVHTVIDNTVGILGRTVDKRVSIVVNKGAMHSRVMGDSSEIQNALMNLAINASKSIIGKGEIQITTSNTELDKDYCDALPFDVEVGEYIQLDIRDNGCGISLENLERIFEPFFTTSETGTGLGLPAVYGTVKSHKGAIKVYSEEGKGTVFHIYFPVIKDHIDSSQTSSAELELGSGTILLVDDERIIRRVGKGMLEKMGYTVMTAENGVEAIDIFEKEHDQIDLIILDMIMPHMNGREAFARMKEIDGGCRILISSGFWKEEDALEMTESGIAGFIRKPFMASELSRVIKDILNS